MSRQLRRNRLWCMVSMSVLILALVLFLPSRIPIAYAGKPINGINCHNYSCDFVYPHYTDGTGGSNCVGDWQAAVSQGIPGFGGVYVLAYSGGNCQSVWASFVSPSKVWTLASICIFREGPNPNQSCRGSYNNVTGPIDSRMLGMDPTQTSCFHMSLTLTDPNGTTYFPKLSGCFG